MLCCLHAIDRLGEEYNNLLQMIKQYQCWWKPQVGAIWAIDGRIIIRSIDGG